MRKALRGLIIAGSGTVASALLGAVVMKIIATFGGPGAVALYSQLRQLAHWLCTLATFNGHGSIAYGIANLNPESRANFLSTIATIYCVGCVIVSVVLVILAPSISTAFFGALVQDVSFAVRFTTVGVVAGTLFSFCMGILLGHGAVGQLVVMQLAGGLAAALLAYPVTHNQEPWTYVLLFIATYLTSSIVGLALIIRNRLIPRLSLSLDLRALRLHIAYAGTTLGIVFITMAAFLAIRAICIHTLGLESTGMVDAAFTISGLFAHAFLVPLENYWFSRLASTVPTDQLARTLAEALRLVTLGAVLGVTFVIAFRTLLIAVFYTSEFFPAADLLRLMAIGDFFRITGWILRVCLLARGDKKGPLFAELLLSVALVAPVSVYVHLGWEIIGMAYLSANAAWLVFIILRFHHTTTVWPSLQSCIQWLLGLAVVVVAMTVCWNDAGIEPYRSGLVWGSSMLAFLGLAFFVHKTIRSEG